MWYDKTKNKGYTMTNIKLTERSKKLFLEYANDAANWSGNPLVGGNVGGSKSDRGNLTDLKKKGLLKTFNDGEGHMWVTFTEIGKEYAKENGVDNLE